MNARIIPFTNERSAMFKSLNEEWLQHYFTLEPVDQVLLSYPRKEIIDKGGHIFFAEYQGEIVGTVALNFHEEGVFELGKMAVTKKVQGIGIGSILMEHCINNAKSLGARKLILYSNTALASAIHLYKKFGFVEVPFTESNYKRTNIKMEIQFHKPS
ncbi:MAG: GNAT family N-acetyltransferase [Bacteroidota bacterium]